MKLEDWYELNSRLQQSLERIERLPRFVRRDLRRMSRPAIDLLRQADQERVICRRRRNLTPQFERLMQQAQEALTNFEGHVIFASLLKEPE